MLLCFNKTHNRVPCTLFNAEKMILPLFLPLHFHSAQLKIFLPLLYILNQLFFLAVAFSQRVELHYPTLLMTRKS